MCDGGSQREGDRVRKRDNETAREELANKTNGQVKHKHKTKSVKQTSLQIRPANTLQNRSKGKISKIIIEEIYYDSIL